MFVQPCVSDTSSDLHMNVSDSHVEVIRYIIYKFIKMLMFCYH